VGFGGTAGNQHAFASSGTSSGISRTGEAFVPNTGKRQLGIAVAIVSLLVGGAIVAAVVAFGRGAHPVVSVAGGASAQPPVITAATTATATAAVDRLPALEASSNAPGAGAPSATTALAHTDKPPVSPPQPQHGAPSHPPGTAAAHANPSGGPAPAGTVDLGY
jgi:hypothetical protein